LTVVWPGCVSKYVVTSAKRVGFLFKKARQHYQREDEENDELIDKLEVLQYIIKKQKEDIERLELVNKKCIERIKTLSRVS
jgi:hypothetical protein